MRSDIDAHGLLLMGCSTVDLLSRDAAKEPGGIPGIVPRFVCRKQ